MSVQEETTVEMTLSASPSATPPATPPATPAASPAATPPTPPPTPVANEVNNLFDESLGELKSRIADKEVNAATLMTILRIVMEIVEPTHLKGTTQKELAKRLIRQVVVDAPIADEREKLLLDMIDQDIIGNTIDLVVAATHGKLDINSIEEVAKTCCLPLISKLVKKYV